MKNYIWFIKSSLSRFNGEWVAILNKKIITHGLKGRDVFQEVNTKYPNKKPLFARVPDSKPICY